MRGLQFFLHYTWLYAVGRSKHFLMYRILRYPHGDKITVHIFEKAGWSTHVKVGSDGYSQLLQGRAAPVSLNVEVLASLVSRIWFAVRDCRMTSGNSGQQLPGF